MKKIDIAAYAESLAKEDRTRLGPVIEKELLHYEIIRAMAQDNLTKDLVFQGGTCLRLCYGAPRFSEDLDFVGGLDFDADSLVTLKDCITNALPEKYALTVRVKEPKPIKVKALVQRWRIVIDTTPSRPDIASKRISLEVASIPSYTNEPRLLQLNYAGIPASYGDIILTCESLEEILADKMLAFVCAPQIRYRDLWDMFWIMRRPGIDIDKARELRAMKETDYGEQEGFQAGLARVTAELETIIESDAFKLQMQRFLPTDVWFQTVNQPEYRGLLVNGIQTLYSQDHVS